MYFACFQYFVEQVTRSSHALLYGLQIQLTLQCFLHQSLRLRPFIQLLATTALWFFNRTSVFKLLRRLFGNLAPIIDLYPSSYTISIFKLPYRLLTPDTLELCSSYQAGWIWMNVISQQPPPDATSLGSNFQIIISPSMNSEISTLEKTFLHKPSSKATGKIFQQKVFELQDQNQYIWVWCVKGCSD